MKTEREIYDLKKALTILIKSFEEDEDRGIYDSPERKAERILELLKMFEGIKEDKK